MPESCPLSLNGTQLHQELLQGWPGSLLQSFSVQSVGASLSKWLASLKASCNHAKKTVTVILSAVEWLQPFSVPNTPEVLEMTSSCHCNYFWVGWGWPQDWCALGRHSIKLHSCAMDGFVAGKQTVFFLTSFKAFALLFYGWLLFIYGR